MPPVNLTPKSLAAAFELNAALYHWERLSERPRSVNAWAFLECRLWNARQDAVKHAVLERGTPSYEIVSARFRDAQGRRENGRMFESAGQENVRV